MCPLPALALTTRTPFEAEGDVVVHPAARLANRALDVLFEELDRETVDHPRTLEAIRQRVATAQIALESSVELAKELRSAARHEVLAMTELQKQRLLNNRCSTERAKAIVYRRLGEKIGEERTVYANLATKIERDSEKVVAVTALKGAQAAGAKVKLGVLKSQVRAERKAAKAEGGAEPGAPLRRQQQKRSFAEVVSDERRTARVSVAHPDSAPDPSVLPDPAAGSRADSTDARGDGGAPGTAESVPAPADRARHADGLRDREGADGDQGAARGDEGAAPAEADAARAPLTESV